ncbi:hypothetical protein KDW_60300 [Dictyobacter vulcani]|uniref:Uncharacterized protein n=1 Tax=Dictyobacter vulcani TaxID=2607529 RepID=A0A5J4KQ95_9CHLR|nr:hypothetical protein KDW_60300 [Dictyobacter vulcani]
MLKGRTKSKTNAPSKKNEYRYRRANVFSQIIAQAHQQYDNEYRNQEPETDQTHIGPEVVIQEMRDLNTTID